MKIQSLLAAGAVLLAASMPGQEAKKGIIAEGGTPDDRASARVLYWNQKTDSAAGQFAIDYGRPRWKPDYEDAAKFDAMTRGRVWRMGSNFWTELDTSVPLKIAGKEVGVGSYYLGLHRSEDGSHWSLAFIDPAAVRSAGLDAFEVQKAQVVFEAPMASGKPPAAKAEKLTITLSYPKTNPRHVTLKVAWGTLALTAPIEAQVSE
jgi:hypothetical protein